MSKGIVNEAVSHGTELVLMLVAVLGAIAAIAYAWFKFVKASVIPVGDDVKRPAFANLLYRKYYVDEIYQIIIEKPVLFLSSLLHVIDVYVIDRVVDGFGIFAVWIGGRVRLIQTGAVGFYLVAMVLSIIAFLVFGLLI